MPNFGPGIPNNVNLSYTPTWLFTPSNSATNNVRLANIGRNTVYVGQADVTVNTGMPLLPGGKPVEITNVLNSLYAISAYQVGALIGTITTAATAGSTTQIFASGAVAQLPVGTQFMIGSTIYTSNQEVLNVSASIGTTTVGTSSAAQFAHGTVDNIYLVTPSYGQISVIGGVL
jgi:predicted RecA/RadA family phage recombinase